MFYPNQFRFVPPQFTTEAPRFMFVPPSPHSSKGVIRGAGASKRVIMKNNNINPLHT
ncbi:hypothetical protein LX66_2966 [Chitinophaga japonensis]|uniref:Uncharacterized protein n=1 Tax=Chitinophaga japonensis TaxID=104662 RepID=A0A562T6I0_CHIJA|nr:hypothetical protein LX66_2966 [Chitinophaga japonensis]